MDKDRAKDSENPIPAHPVLTLVNSSDEIIREIPCVPEFTVCEALRSAGVKLRTSCGGNGNCGHCRILVLEGGADAPSQAEMSLLNAGELERGFRLACRLKPAGNLKIQLTDSIDLSSGQSCLSESTDNDVPPLFLPAPIHIRPPDPPKRYGAAVDLGTTHIRISVCDLKARLRVASRTIVNPQTYYGTDILTRLEFTLLNPGNAREISSVAAKAMGTALERIARDFQFRAADIGRILFVGNTAMLTILAGKNFDLLLDPGRGKCEIDCRPLNVEELRRNLGLETGTEIELAKPLAGFIGSDLLAGVIASDLTGAGAGSLYIDFGTNSEIALWDGKKIISASAAGGPAFEGGGIGCGMLPGPGAVYAARMTDDGTGLVCDTIGGLEARGLCGSAMVDIIAELTGAGILDDRGRFAPGAHKNGYRLGDKNGGLILKKRDVDSFQRAKAAIGGAVVCLMDAAGMRTEDLKNIYISGAFGKYLDIKNAIRIGLLPAISPRNIYKRSNAALSGAEYLLFHRNSIEVIESLKNRSDFTDLSFSDSFDKNFVKNLFIKPFLR
ncbi:MAG: hypothetical protein A2008_01250 [Candidatus Wallbacteria bacterium GWC2_49_35]|uniref:2Fe-2S ferredoxin-type domain-containing protein n=1 Tax=Candidatus Wallbacteria bacterium GWC2_49_35 TaxID=1817813 RepID=A0A1F7WSK8_9BACT|nr:MAG: hypothetical protein A2008_01250 [Candidatus Wallbacteria bacterium GWC2_49_35]